MKLLPSLTKPEMVLAFKFQEYSFLRVFWAHLIRGTVITFAIGAD